jgi:acyl phosphate:glycerol-3-phosphate acyltransferase
VSALPAMALVAAAYLLGAVPFGLLVGRTLAGLDVRTVGSGNIGATNVARAAGWRLGALVLALDALKGVAPPLAALALPLPPWAPIAAGAAAIAGHVFPVYLRFKGGKGVATALGVFLVLAPLPTLAGALAFGAVYALSRVVSAGSMAGLLSACATSFALHGATQVSWLLAATAGLVLVRHRGNIARLLARQERKL